MVLATGAIAVLPDWAHGWAPANLDPVNSCFDAEEESVLSALADAIIPAGKEDIGARSLGVDQFLNRLFSDCYEEEVQKQIKQQLGQIMQHAKDTYNIKFQDCQWPQKMTIVEQLAWSHNEETREIFQLIKSETIRGFRTSKVVMTEYLDYQVMPGYFDGCAEVSV